MERLILITPKVIHLDEIPTTPPAWTTHIPQIADAGRYEERVPAAPQSGCSRKRPEPGDGDARHGDPVVAARGAAIARSTDAGTACGSAMSASGLIVFRLFSGPHMGAELVLPAGNQLVGSDDSCDIILQDSSVASGTRTSS